MNEGYWYFRQFYYDRFQYIVDRSPLVFVYYSAIVEPPQPRLPNVVYVGDSMISTKIVEKKEKHFSKFSSLFKPGKPLIAVAFGHYGLQLVPTLAVQIFRSLLACFKEKPHINFLWSASHDAMENISIEAGFSELPKNVIFEPWMPLNDLMRAGRIRLLIFHGGTKTFMEALNAKIPMITIAFKYDQYRISDMIEKRGLGQYIPIPELTPDKLCFSIDSLLYGPERTAIIKRLTASGDAISAEIFNSEKIVNVWMRRIVNHAHHGEKIWRQNLPKDVWLSVEMFIIILFAFVILLSCYSIAGASKMKRRIFEI